MKVSKTMQWALDHLKAGRLIYVFHDDPRCRIKTPGSVCSHRIHYNTVAALRARGLIRLVPGGDGVSKYELAS